MSEITQGANFVKRWWRSVDQQMIFALVVLFTFSFILVTTSGPAVAARIGLSEGYFSSRQVFYLILSGVLILLFSSFNKKWLKRIALLGFFASLIILCLVKFYGYEVKGAVRWISLLGISVQPSEFIKPFFAVVVGWILSLKYEDRYFPGFMISGALYVVVGVLLIIQPDFGMLVMITAVYCIQLFVAGMPIVWILLAVITGGLGVVGAYMVLPHVRHRINSFLDPNSTENYQVSKSLMAYEHGGMYGKGPGEGVVKQILPDSHTDFIFAVAGEEFGAIICLLVIVVFAFIVLKSIKGIIREEDKFSQFAAIGIISQFALQTIINIGVTLNLLPTKGMTLPFISYGGCSTLAVSMGVGMLLGFTRQQPKIMPYKFRESL